MNIYFNSGATQVYDITKYEIPRSNIICVL